MRHINHDTSISYEIIWWMINIILTGLFSAGRQIPSGFPRPHRFGQKGNGDMGKFILNPISYLTSQQCTFLDSLPIERCSSHWAACSLYLLILSHLCVQKAPSFYQKLKIPSCSVVKEVRKCTDQARHVRNKVSALPDTRDKLARV